jgi:hypothetical protein
VGEGLHGALVMTPEDADALCRISQSVLERAERLGPAPGPIEAIAYHCDGRTVSLLRNALPFGEHEPIACRLCGGEHLEYAHNGRIVVVPPKEGA